MYFTLSALIIILFFMPGILFRKGYMTYPFSRKFSRKGLQGDFVAIVIYSTIIHSVFILWAHINTDAIDEIIRQLIGVINDMFASQLKHETLKEVNIRPFITYNLGIWVISYYIGYLIRTWVYVLRLDCFFLLFRYDNPWFYYLKGRYLEFADVRGQLPSEYFMWADVFCINDSVEILYKGILESHELNSQGELFSIVLKGTQKKVLSSTHARHEDTHDYSREKNADQDNFSLTGQENQGGNNNIKYGFTAIVGDYFIIPGNTISNLNITIYKINKVKGPPLRATDWFGILFKRFIDLITLVVIYQLLYKIFRAINPKKR